MLIKRLRELLLSLTILPMLVQPVMAHATWIISSEQEGEFEILYGHPERNEVEPYDPIKFQEATAYDGTGRPLPLTVNRENDGVTLIPPRDVTAITAIHNNGYFIQTGEDEYENVFRPEALEANTEEVEVSHTYKFAKFLNGPSRIALQELGLPLEIVPLEDPFAVETGGNLRIQVIFQGNPQAGATVEYGGEQLTTDEEGIASVTLKQGDLQVIEAGYTVTPTDDPAADEIGYTTSLTIDKRTIDKR